MPTVAATEVTDIYRAKAAGIELQAAVSPTSVTDAAAATASFAPPTAVVAEPAVPGKKEAIQVVDAL